MHFINRRINLFWFLVCLFCTYSSFPISLENPVPPQQDERQHEEKVIDTDGKSAAFSEFPNLHPLVVHFPVVLIPLALLFQIMSFFWRSKAMSATAMLLLAIGITGGFLASFLFHPEIGELDMKVQEVFDTHKSYAYYTLYLGGGALLLKVISYFLIDNNRIAEIIVLLLLLAGSYTVAYSGHLGSQMVYIEGIGPQGKHLEEQEQ
ncbi:MAG: DUF2231 domain-containing protein [Salinimicrobium sp.]